MVLLPVVGGYLGEYDVFPPEGIKGMRVVEEKTG